MVFDSMARACNWACSGRLLGHHVLGQLHQIGLPLDAGGGQGAADLADMSPGVVVDQGGDDGDAEGAPGCAAR
jgi:hypothetical protein